MASGVQNGISTKYSGSIIRTTHVTGMYKDCVYLSYNVCVCAMCTTYTVLHMYSNSLFTYFRRDMTSLVHIYYTDTKSQ